MCSSYGRVYQLSFQLSHTLLHSTLLILIGWEQAFSSIQIRNCHPITSRRYKEFIIFPYLLVRIAKLVMPDEPRTKDESVSSIIFYRLLVSEVTVESGSSLQISSQESNFGDALSDCSCRSLQQHWELSDLRYFEMTYIQYTTWKWKCLHDWLKLSTRCMMDSNTDT